MPKVTVIIPVYNVEQYIGSALESLLNQDERDIEVIVVDDGSTDGTVKKIESYTDTRLRLIKQSNSGKPAIARNVGIAAAHGEFICFLDGDDIYLPGKLEKSLKVLEKFPDVNIVFHDVQRMSSSGKLQNKTYLQNLNFMERASDFITHIEFTSLYIGTDRFYNFTSSALCGIHTSSIMIRFSRLMREQIWFCEDMTCGEDIDLWFRLVKGSRVIYINEPLSVYRFHDESMTQDRVDFYLGTIKAHCMNFERAKNILTLSEKKYYLRRIAKRYQHLAYCYHQKLDMRKARENYKRSFELEKDLLLIVSYLKTYIPKSMLKLRWSRKKGDFLNLSDGR